MGRRPPIDFAAGTCHEGISAGAGGSVDGKENIGVGAGVDADTEDEYDAEDVTEDRTPDFLLPEFDIIPCGSRTDSLL